jgi:hypothetical protein
LKAEQNGTHGILESACDSCSFSDYNCAGNAQDGVQTGSGSSRNNWSSGTCTSNTAIGFHAVAATALCVVSGLSSRLNGTIYTFDVLWQVMLGQEKVTRTINTTPVDAIHADEVLLVDASGGARVVNLPAANVLAGKHFHVKKTDVSGNTVTVQVTGGGLIDGAATALIAVAGESIHVVSDGTAHYVV